MSAPSLPEEFDLPNVTSSKVILRKSAPVRHFCTVSRTVPFFSASRAPQSRRRRQVILHLFLKAARGSASVKQAHSCRHGAFQINLGLKGYKTKNTLDIPRLAHYYLLTKRLARQLFSLGGGERERGGARYVITVLRYAELYNIRDQGHRGSVLVW